MAWDQPCDQLSLGCIKAFGNDWYPGAVGLLEWDDPGHQGQILDQDAVPQPAIKSFVTEQQAQQL